MSFISEGPLTAYCFRKLESIQTITLFLALVVICDCSESAGSYNYATAEAEEEQYPLEERKAGADDHSPSRENDIHA